MTERASERASERATVLLMKCLFAAGYFAGGAITDDPIRSDSRLESGRHFEISLLIGTLLARHVYRAKNYPQRVTPYNEIGVVVIDVPSPASREFFTLFLPAYGPRTALFADGDI